MPVYCRKSSDFLLLPINLEHHTGANRSVLFIRLDEIPVLCRMLLRIEGSRARERFGRTFPPQPAGKQRPQSDQRQHRNTDETKCPASLALHGTLPFDSACSTHHAFAKTNRRSRQIS